MRRLRTDEWLVSGILAVALSIGCSSTASADACWDHWRAKLEAISAPAYGYIAALKTTGDCSYVEEIIENAHQWKAVAHSVPCKNMHWNPGLNDDQMRTKWTRYCKPQSQSVEKKQAAPQIAGAPLKQPYH
jgi:hypothetical protein